MKKKILALCLVVVLAVTAVTGATLAYFSDADSAKNVFTVGNVDIELQEKGNVKLNDEEQKDKLDGNGHDGYTYKNLVPGNVITKTPVIKNLGDNAAYVRAVVTIKGKALDINKALDVVYEMESADATQAKYDEVFVNWGINYNPRGRQGVADDARGIIDDLSKLPNKGENILKVDFVKAAHHSTDRILFGLENWFKSDAEKAAPSYVVDTALKNGYYTQDLKMEDIRYVYYIALDKGETATLFTGLNVPADFDSKRDVTESEDEYFGGQGETYKTVDQMAMFKDLVIEIEVDAIQQEGFDGVADEGSTLVFPSNVTDDAQRKAYEAFVALEAAHPMANDKDNVVTKVDIF